MLARPVRPSPELIASGLIVRRAVGRSHRWLLLRGAKHHEWGFPKGHQEPRETLLATALRECAEETGIGLVAIEGAPLELHYAVPSGRSKRAVYFPAVTSCVEITLSDEHIAASWFTRELVLERLGHPNIRALFLAYLRGLA